MSYETWKAEFMPEAPADAALASTVSAVKHSMLKWEGLGEENLAKHNGRKLVASRVTRFAEEERVAVMSVNSDTCALCLRFYSCVACPITAVRHGACCCIPTSDESHPPWQVWTLEGDPIPMQKVLKAALLMVEAAGWADPPPEELPAAENLDYLKDIPFVTYHYDEE